MMKKLIPILLIATLLAGCAGLTAVTPPPPSGAPTEQPATPDADTQPSKPANTEEPASEDPTPVVPVSSSAVCVPSSEHPDLAYTSYEEFPQTIMDYLNAGASPEELAVSLIIQDLGPSQQPVWAEDLTGDGVREVAVTVFNQQQPPQGAMLIFNCQDGQYVLNYTAVSSQDAHAPRLRTVQDINNDSKREVLLTSTNCGAHTCFEDVRILAWDGTEYVNKLEGSTLDFPYPELKLTDFNHDGIYSLEVIGTSIASVGAGPQRDTINIWDFDPANGNWALTKQSEAASPFRVHLMHDAEAAMDRGEYLITSLLFQQVIEDDTYLEWASEVSEKNNLSAYAYFKRIVAAVFLDDRPTALALFEDFEDLYSGTDQAGYVEMAAAFLTDSETLGLEEGCTSARLYAEANPEAVLTPLGSAVYGYTNPDFEPADVCP